MNVNRAKDVDEYISKFPKDIQKILKQIRSTVKKAAPSPEDHKVCHSYLCFIWQPVTFRCI